MRKSDLLILEFSVLKNSCKIMLPCSFLTQVILSCLAVRLSGLHNFSQTTSRPYFPLSNHQGKLTSILFVCKFRNEEPAAEAMTIWIIDEQFHSFDILIEDSCLIPAWPDNKFASNRSFYRALKVNTVLSCFFGASVEFFTYSFLAGNSDAKTPRGAKREVRVLVERHTGEKSL